MFYHSIVVFRLPALRLAPYSVRNMNSEVHPGGVEPDKERFTFLMLALDKIAGCIQELQIYVFHTLASQRAGILYSSVCVAVDYTSGTIVLTEIGKILLRWIIAIFWFFLSIQVIEVPKEFVKAVIGGQVLVPVSKVVLSKLPSGIAKRFKKFGDSWILRLDSHLGPRHAHFAQPGTEGTRPLIKDALPAVQLCSP